MTDKCEYKNCKRDGLSVCIIIDVAGEEYQQLFCKFHIGNMLHGLKPNLKD